MGNQQVIAALYQFRNLENLEEYREKLLKVCTQHGTLGTLILGNEGINGTVAGNREGIDRLKETLLALGFNDLEYKESFAPLGRTLFYRMKVKIKKEIVTMLVPDMKPNEQRANYLSPQDWHELIKNPDVIILDTRNIYEFHIGTFRNAINPNIVNFRDFPAFCEAHREEWKDKTIAMFCTGGIRCEKSTSFATVTNLGKKVYHLKGGILKYLEEIPKDEGLWDGECFVFDYRISVGYGLEIGKYEQCYACRMPLTPKERESSLYVKGISCPYCHSSLTDEQRARFTERQKQITLGSCAFGVAVN